MAKPALGPRPPRPPRCLPVVNTSLPAPSAPDVPAPHLGSGKSPGQSGPPIGKSTTSAVSGTHVSSVVTLSDTLSLEL